MRKMWNRALAVALTTAMTASLAACGSTKNAGTDASTKGNTDTSQTQFDIMSSISALSS